MSHAKERKEKNCLNCKAIVDGRYCSQCGQENLEPEESVMQLIMHFFNDITHFDGKFFSTLKYLILRPGFLSAEYTAGRRAAYLNPVRMYIFTSAAFFLILFSFFTPENNNTENGGRDIGISRRDSLELVAGLKAGGTDPAKLSKVIQESHQSRNGFLLFGHSPDDTFYRDRKQYDSLIAAGRVHDNFFEQIRQRKMISIREKYGDDDDRVQEKLSETLKHYLPEMFFLSLPLFALFLQILYMRRKQHYYTAHFIFTLHLYIFVYIAVLALVILDALASLHYLHWLTYVVAVLGVGIILYAYKAMRNFYRQRRGKTILKFILIIAWLFMIILFLTGAMFFLSFLKL